MVDSPQSLELIHQGMDVITHRTFREHGRFVKAAGLSIPQFGILIQLHYQHKCGISDISNRMDISSAAASQLVDKLVQSGLVERAEDPIDRRAKQLKLTEKGRVLVETSMAERHQWVDKMMEFLNPSEQEKVAEVMVILTRALQQMKEQEKTIVE
jgi:DNA-binding MarR family transcriptional regulator